MRKRKERGFRRAKITYNRRVPGRWQSTASIIRAYRDNMGYTQEIFAKEISLPWLSVSSVAIVFWEAGDTRPNLNWLKGVLESDVFDRQDWRVNMAKEIMDTGVWNVRYPSRVKQA